MNQDLKKDFKELIVSCYRYFNSNKFPCPIHAPAKQKGSYLEYDDYGQVDKLFSNKKRKSVSLKDIAKNYDLLSFISNQGFWYYYPRFLEAILDDNNYSFTLADFLMYKIFTNGR